MTGHEHPDLALVRIARDLEHTPWYRLPHVVTGVIRELFRISHEVREMRRALDEQVENARQDERAQMRREATIHDLVRIGMAKRALTRHPTRPCDPPDAA